MLSLSLGGIPESNGSYQFALSFDSHSPDELSGTFKRSADRYPCRLTRIQKGITDDSLWRIPSREFDEREVSYRSANVTIAGTLTIPRGRSSSPAVLLLHGSGGGARDVKQGKIRYFASLAQFLARAGVASLRTDARGSGGSGGIYENATLDDLVVDAETAIAFLKQADGVDSRRVGLMGISEGGLVAGICAARPRAVAFAVLLSTSAVPGSETALDQILTKLRKQGLEEDQLDFLALYNKDILNLALTTLPPDRDEQALIAVSRKWNFGDDKVLKLGTDEIRRQVKRLREPAMKRYLLYDPRESLRKIRCPLLSITGSLDDLVIADKNVSQTRVALDRNRDATVLKWPDLNHFLVCNWTGPALPGWDREASYSPEILDYVTDWIVFRESNTSNQSDQQIGKRQT